MAASFSPTARKIRDAKWRFDLWGSLPKWAAIAALLCGTCSASFASADVEVYVAYAENEHLPQTFMPNPWYGSPNTIFLGYPTSPPPAGSLQAWDTGGILIRNVGTTDVVLGPGPKVDGFTDPSKSFSLWNSTAINPGDGLLASLGIPSTGISIHPGEQLILTQTGASRQTGTDYSPTPCNRNANPSLYCYSNFDTSDTPASEKGSTSTPIIHLMLNGVMQTFTDTAQVLNTSGTDLGNLNPAINESVQWRLIGTTGSYLPGRKRGEPAGSHYLAQRQLAHWAEPQRDDAQPAERQLFDLENCVPFRKIVHLSRRRRRLRATSVCVKCAHQWREA